MKNDDGTLPSEAEVETLDLEAQDTVDLEAAAKAALEEFEAGRARSVATESPSAAVSVEDDLGKLQAEIADLRERSIRTLADFDNFRKRSEREREEQRRYALSEVLRDFLAIQDNLDLALGAGGSPDDVRRGVEMISRQLRDLLRRYGVEEVAAQGERFDPAIHEAVSRGEDPHVLEPTVSEVMRRGYRVHERLLRPAMVKVVVPAPPAPATEGAA